MPELPEVEIIGRQIAAHLPLEIISEMRSPVASRIIKENVFNPQGLYLLKILRHGKCLQFIFNRGGRLLSHLGMSGSWRLSAKPLEIKHTHLQLLCRKKNNEEIYLSYIDPRRFGKMYFLKNKAAEQRISGMGPDPLSAKFSVQFVQSTLKAHPKIAIKPLLLNQKYFAGVGNYMASEICARAAVRPTRRAGKISLAEAKAIHQATLDIISLSLDNQGLSFARGYSDTAGRLGKALSYLFVFQQKSCGRCQITPVKKIYQMSRATFFCPHCQK